MGSSKYLYAGVCTQNKRSTNMDSMLLKPKRLAEGESILAVVCDGVGSLADGGFASGIAAKMLCDWFESAYSTHALGTQLADFIRQINLSIIEQAERRNMETASTITTLLLAGSRYHVVHIGDSRVYAYERGTLSMITKDDTSPAGNLRGYIGRRQDIDLQCYDGDSKDKTFLICSDGFHKMMDGDLLTKRLGMLKSTTKDFEKAVAKLTESVISQGEKDNITLALVKDVLM